VSALRVARSAVVALSAIGLALLGHLTAGGSTPTPGTLTMVVLVVWLLSYGLSGRRWTVGPLVAVLLGAQLLFHVVFADATATHAHFGSLAGDASPARGHSALLMLAGHLAAALLTALLLRRGEDWLWGLVGLLARAWRAARIAAARPLDATRALAGRQPGEVPAALGLLEHAVARRGPPVPLAH
jgi:hypothetical protein